MWVMFCNKNGLKEGSQLWGKLGNKSNRKKIAFLNTPYFTFPIRLGTSYDHDEKNISQRGRSYLYNAVDISRSRWQMT